MFGLKSPVREWYPPFAFASHSGCRSRINRVVWRAEGGGEISLARLSLDTGPCLAHFCDYVKSQVSAGKAPKNEVLKFRWADHEPAHFEVRSEEDPAVRRMTIKAGMASLFDASCDSYPTSGSGNRWSHVSGQLHISVSLVEVLFKRLGLGRLNVERLRFNPEPHPLDHLVWAPELSEALLTRPHQWGADLLVETAVVNWLVSWLGKYPHNFTKVIKSVDPASARDPRIERAVRFLHDHFRDPVDWDRVREVSGLGRANFFRLFETVTLTTPKAMLLQLRLSRARQLLRATDFSLDRVAKESGLASEKAMGKAFLRELGVTPKRYRSHG